MKRHPFGFGRFLFGLIFVALAALWLGRDVWNLTAGHVAIAAPATLIALGLVGIIATLRRGNHDQSIDA